LTKTELYDGIVVKEKRVVGSQFYGAFPSDRIPEATKYVNVRFFFSVEIPTRCSFVKEFIIPKFIEDSTCFERNTVHHQEL
jgi:hypothetical protein